MSRLKNLFIDFDDTVYDTRGNAQIALGELFDDMHLERHFPSLEAFTEPYWEHNTYLWKEYAAGRVTRDFLIIDRFRKPLGIGGLQLTDEECIKVSDKFLYFTSQKPGVVEGAHEVMEYLHSKYRTHMTSNGFHEVQFAKLKTCGLGKYFDTVILSEDAPANKPSPLYFSYALEKAGATRDDTIMIGDNYVADITGARDSGIPQIWFNRHPEESWPDFEPTHVITSLSQLYGIL